VIRKSSIEPDDIEDIGPESLGKQLL